jgi:hypothetical protein
MRMKRAPNPAAQWRAKRLQVTVLLCDVNAVREAN